MNTPQIYARATRSFGTNCTIVIVSADHAHGRFAPIAPGALALLHRLIRAGGHGVELSRLSHQEVHALDHDIEHALGIQVRRDRKIGFATLAGNLSVVDQRTSLREVA